eukprot:CAMPEP_0115854828 /NCGR_PEP_ID=MMETSP0287-20121206/14227_1 /TAXON_ID=412157 /ORGANISM="Chrysochromulina rotalis, Strain UIO044" /LENGTH=113 /DNA_ID=CAMNT_0003308961 /DNA_START=369 /DNA_END=710 /DNA_ORIENTATION=+
MSITEFGDSTVGDAEVTLLTPMPASDAALRARLRGLQGLVERGRVGIFRGNCRDRCCGARTHREFLGHLTLSRCACRFLAHGSSVFYRLMGGGNPSGLASCKAGVPKATKQST